MKEAINYKKISQNRVECRACCHFCKISENKAGICGVRINRQGKLFSLTWGKIIGGNIDPIEKKPLFHFLPGTKSFSFGSLGCNFRCGNCQNFDISQMYGFKGRTEKYKSLYWGEEVTPKKLVELALSYNCESISYTYNEPTVNVEMALETMIEAKKRGLKNVWVSNGYFSDETFNAVSRYLDAANIDLKSFSDKFYRENCGARLEPVLDNLKKVVKERIWLEVTTLLIPGFTDDDENLHKIAHFIRWELGNFVPWHLSAFSASISWKMKDVPDTRPERVIHAVEIGRRRGLKYVYPGNIPTNSEENTLCPKCGSLVVKRSGFSAERLDKSGKCPDCSFKIPGVWK